MPQRIEPNRKCEECGTTKTTLVINLVVADKKRKYPRWHAIKDNPGKYHCDRCFKRLRYHAIKRAYYDFMYTSPELITS